jgi:hypothetical protein
MSQYIMKNKLFINYDITHHCIGDVFSRINKVIIFAILSTVLIAVIGIQNANASSSSGGFTSLNDNGLLTNDARITVLSKTVRTIYSGFVVSHYELRGELRNDGNATSRY